MPNLEQQQRHAQRMAELEASALGRRGAAGGGALGGRVINPVADPRSTGLVAKHKAGGAPDVVEDATAPSSGVVEDATGVPIMGFRPPLDDLDREDESLEKGREDDMSKEPISSFRRLRDDRRLSGGRLPQKSARPGSGAGSSNRRPSRRRPWKKIRKYPIPYDGF